MAVVGVAAAAWPFIDQMNPSAAALALASTEIDISTIVPGQQIVFKWRGHPLFVRRRTPAEIARPRRWMSHRCPIPWRATPTCPTARRPPMPTAPSSRNGWSLIGVCTHLGCTPTFPRRPRPKAIMAAGSATAMARNTIPPGRIRKGPAPQNLAVPPYAFLSDTRIKVG